MKRLFKKKQKVVKGTSSAIFLSLLIHAGLFLLAGLLVIFSVIDKPEPKFTPPPVVDRPKMKLKKPQVRLKKAARPKQTAKIVTKVNRATMPDIQLPEMSGVGDGLTGGGLGGFDMLPDLAEVSLLGTRASIGSDLEGTFYDFNRTQSGAKTSIEVEGYRGEFQRFLRSGWKRSTIAKYYQPPDKIYATCLVVPPVLSSIAPSAFGDRDASGALWMVLYKGQIVHSEGITFRFCGNADETMAVRVAGKIVLGVRWENPDTGGTNVEPDPIGGLWDTPDAKQSRRYYMGNNRAVVGDWITLEPGVPQDIEIAIGDNGGQACFILAVQEQGVEYPKGPQGNPILPAFKTAALSHDLLDAIYKNLVDGEICLTNGPVFNDYGSGSGRVPVEVNTPSGIPDTAAPSDSVEEHDGSTKVWTLDDATSFEATFVTVTGTEAVFKTAKGKQVKIPFDKLVEKDRTFIELARPPKFDINFTKDSEQKTFTMEAISTANADRPPEIRSHYGVRIRQTSAGTYNHEVLVEFFAIGQERLGQKYILLDRQTTSFTPTRDNKQSHEFKSPREVVLENFEIEEEPRGETYAGYLVTLTDERGKTIAVDTSDNWLAENLGNLRQLPVGAYMDKSCTRVFPTRPPRTRY